MFTMWADKTAAEATLATITEKQRQVLDLVVQHWTSKEIGRALGISPNTVDQRINAVRAKLAARDRAETARLYAELNSICGRTIYGPAVVAAAAPAQLPSRQNDPIDPVFSLSDSVQVAPDDWDHLADVVVPGVRLRDSKLWRAVAIVLIAVGIVILATTILAVMQALNAMI